MVRVVVAGGSSSMTCKRDHPCLEDGESTRSYCAVSSGKYSQVSYFAAYNDFNSFQKLEGPLFESLTTVITDYDDLDSLVQTLKGAEVLLSFISPMIDKYNQAQENLIDAAVKAGVKRFAPSEWMAREPMAFEQDKYGIRKYLKEVNEPRQVLQYCIFTPGILIDWLVHPRSLACQLTAFQNQFDFDNNRVLIREGGLDDRMSFIKATDLARMVVAAIEYEGEWPVMGGVRGTDVSMRELIPLIEKIKGCSVKAEFVVLRDLDQGIVTTSWWPNFFEKEMAVNEAHRVACFYVASVMRGVSEGILSVPDEWNQLLPAIRLTPLEECFAEVWQS